MANIQGSNIKETIGVESSHALANSIRASLGGSFESNVPLASATNVAEFGAGVLSNQSTQNDFIATLVQRIGKVVVRRVTLKNDLKKFKKGDMPLGSKIEEVFTDITKGQRYNVEDSEQTVFKRTIPNVKTLFHMRNREDRYDGTIQDASLQAAFVSWDKFDEFVASIFNSLTNSAEVEEFEYMKSLIDGYYDKGLFHVIKINKPDTPTATNELVKKVRAAVIKLSLSNGSREYNSLAVRTRSEMQNLHIIMDADLRAAVDVDTLAGAFNMDKVSFLANVTVIDGFKSKGLELVLVDESFFMVYDNLIKMEAIRNPKGLYWNHFLHVWQTLSVSRFANAVAFVSGEVPAVTQVIVDPAILSMRKGREYKYTVYIRQTDDKEYKPKWEVTGDFAVKSTIVDGVLKVAEDEQNEVLKVKAIVNIGTEDDPINVIGTSEVTIISDVRF